MPRVTLGRDAKQKELELRENTVLIEQLKLCGKTVKEIAEATEISAESISQCKAHPEKVSAMSFERVRRLAHECGMTKAAWNALGGFK